MEVLLVLALAYIRSLEQPNSEINALAVLASAYVRSLEQPNSETKALAVLASAHIRSLEQPNSETKAPGFGETLSPRGHAFSIRRTAPKRNLELYTRNTASALRVTTILSKAPLEKGGWGVEKTLNPKRLYYGWLWGEYSFGARAPRV